MSILMQAAEPESLIRKVAKSHNISEETYRHIVQVLGRTPSITEIGIYGVMYSEHCSYCSSRPYLKTFPTTGSRVLVKAGEENAGAIDLGDGQAVVFKCESHNHPSAIEPYEGAATGVGGIVRDIFTMGARPIALLNSLRFGPIDKDSRSKFLLNGVVSGIAGYGNCIGVPTVGGEIAFDESYRENPLVNVMCIGLIPKANIAKGAAKGIGNPVLYVGSSTGKDGLGGASFASRELDEASQADRPAVQIGDPFAEKCLIEATLEALATGDVIGIQDMGAAGLTCSTCETASRGNSGIEIDVLKVPRREIGMTPYEVMLSESQERMLLIVKQGTQERVKRLFARWELNAVEIGHVTDTGRMVVREGKKIVADIPVKSLTDDAPVYHRPKARPAYLDKVQKLDLTRIPLPADYAQVLTRLLMTPTIANKAPVYEQYDHMVQTNTVVLPGAADAAVLRLKGTSRWLAATLDGNGRFCYLDPYEGGKYAVAEAARNIVSVGASPLAVTDCLNFANPQDPEIMWQFAECVRGIADACRAFETPVIGGNVSLYNESPSGPVDPTPVIGMVGVIEGGQKPITASFKDAGDIIVLLGETREELGGSAYLADIHGLKAGLAPRVDLDNERALQRVVIEAAKEGSLKSAHDCSDGGLAVALAESCIMDSGRRIGASIENVSCAGAVKMRLDAWLFGESSGRLVATCAPDKLEALKASAERHRLALSVLGKVGGRRLVIGEAIDVPVDALNEAWRTAFGKLI